MELWAFSPWGELAGTIDRMQEALTLAIDQVISAFDSQHLAATYSLKFY